MFEATIFMDWIASNGRFTIEFLINIQRATPFEFPKLPCANKRIVHTVATDEPCRS